MSHCSTPRSDPHRGGFRSISALAASGFPVCQVRRKQRLPTGFLEHRYDRAHELADQYGRASEVR